MIARTAQHLINKAIQEYTNGLSSTEIARSLGISVSAVTAHVRKAGISRSQAEAKAAQYARRPPKIIPPIPGKVYTSSSSGMKTCAACLQTLAATIVHFYPRKRSNGRMYLSSICRSCMRAARTTRYRSDPEAARLANARSREKYGEKYNERRRIKFAQNDLLRAKKLAKTKEWVGRNKDYICAARAAARSADLAKYKEKAHERWASLSPEKRRALRQAYKARKKSAMGRYTPEDLVRVVEAQGGCCFWCQVPLSGDYHADHYVPLSRGGSNYQENIVAACPTCNTSRGAKMPDEFLEYLALIEAQMPAVMARREYMREKMKEHRARKKIKA